MPESLPNFRSGISGMFVIWSWSELRNTNSAAWISCVDQIPVERVTWSAGTLGCRNQTLKVGVISIKS